MLNKIAIFGATGRTGMQILQQALTKNYKINALVRNTNNINIQHPNIQYIIGSLNEENIALTLDGCDAVISVLGHSKQSPPRFQTEAMQIIISCMSKLSIRRLIVLTGSGVAFDRDKNTFVNTLLTLIIKKIAPNRFIDGELQCRIIEKSDCEWTIVRAPVLTNTSSISNYKTGFGSPGLTSYVSRANVAHFILNELEKKEFIGKAPFIENCRIID